MKRFLGLLGFILLISLAVSAQSKVILSAADPYPPFVDPGNSKEGLSLEIIRAAYATQGYTVKHEFVPWARAVDGTKKSTYDILPDCWDSAERRADFAFSEPYAVNEVKFIKRKGDGFEYNGMDSLKGKVIGIVRDYTYTDEFIKSTVFKREEAQNLLTNVKKLIGQRIDLTLDDQIVASATINNSEPALLSQVEFVKNPLSSNSLYVTCALKNPRSKEIIDAFNKGFAIIKANGTYKKIMESYGIK